MAAGVRVIRGPDWSKGNEDGGEGHVGTVVQYGSDGSAKVVWDSGAMSTCRIGQGGKHDLRIFDNATLGVRHTKICDGCTENGILGIRWKCSKCDDVDLCSVCYVTDRHDLTHPFLRYDTLNAKPVQVPKRNSSVKVRCLGIFPGAEVVRGKDWKWANQDGGPGKKGTVTEMTTASSRSARSTVKVRWGSGQENTYRMGYEGAVDLKYMPEQEAPGPEYFPQHLPVLDANTTKFAEQSVGQDSGIKEGDKVCIELDEMSLRELQKQAGSWSSGMGQLVGKVGVVEGFSQAGEATVNFGTQKYRLVPKALRKVPKLCVGDVVQILDDEEKVTNMQEDHGGWLDVMGKVLGKRGRVVKVDSDGDVAVKFGGNLFLFNPACCTKVDGEVDEDDDDDSDDSDDDDSDNEITEDLLRLQLGGGAAMANFIAGLALLDVLSQAQQQAGSGVFIKAIVEGETAAVRNMLQEDSDLANVVHNGIPALHVAAHEGKTDIVKILIEKGAKKDVRDKDGDTALNIAIMKQHADIADYLVRIGADVNTANEKCRAPIHNAAYTGQTRIIRSLIARGCDVNVRDVGGDTALHDAIEKGHVDAVDALMSSPKLDLRAPNKKGFAPIHVAALKDNARIVEKMLRKNREIVNMAKVDGFTALHLAAFNDHTDIIKILIKNGADINAKTLDGLTPLHLACLKAYFDPVEILVNNRANVNLGDKDGDTPLHVVLMTQTRNLVLEMLVGLSTTNEEGRIRIATFLIQHGADTNARNTRNKTPMDVCPSERMKQAVSAFQRTTPKSRPMSPDGRPLLCSSCFEVRANAVYLPCGHKDTCRRCCRAIRACGQCGRDISKKIGEDGKKIDSECSIQ